MSAVWTAVVASGLLAAAPASFEEIVAPGPDAYPQRCEQMQAWIDANPADPRVPRGLVWMGQLMLLHGDLDAADAIFQRGVDRFPGTAWALHGEHGRAQIALEHWRFSDALKRYEVLEQSGDPFFAYLGEQGVRETRAVRQRVGASALLLLLLAAAWVALARRAGGLRALWPPPAALTAVLPVPLLLGLLAFRQPPGEARALWVMAGGTSLTLWVNGAWLNGGRPTRRTRALVVVAGAVQVAAVLYCAVALGGVWDKFRDTLIMGAE